MPLLFVKHPFEGMTLGFWQIAEEADFFRENLPLSAEEEAELAAYKGIRQLEWLAVRYLLHRLTGAPARLPLRKDAFSKPFFPGHQHLACSLSHSRGLVGAMLVETDLEDQPDDEASPNHPYGIDLQMMVDKMNILAPKFLSTAEAEFVAAHPPAICTDLNHIFWTSKESLYKAYGLKALDFGGNMYVHPFEWDGRSGTARATIEKDDYRQDFQLWFEKMQLPEDENAYFWTLCRPMPTAGI